MRAYFAMVWDENNPNGVRTAHDIRVRLQKTGGYDRHLKIPGFEIYDLSADASRNSIVSIPHEGRKIGAVFGTLFDRFCGTGKQTPKAQLKEEDGTSLSRSYGRAMVTDFWGNYVAFIRCGRSFVVINDPTASFPCFYTAQDGVTLIFSHLEKCSFLDMSKFSINYGFIEKLLAYDKIQTEETGLNEINELLAGQRLSLSDQGSNIEFVWDPRKIADDVHEPSPARAAEELKETTKAVVQSRAAPFAKITVRLSGGLDSSIILACLSEQTVSRNVNALHYIVDANDLPEDRYAQIAADHAHCELLKVAQNPSEKIPEIADHPLTVRPHREFGSRSLLADFGENELEIGDGIFTGQGGDHLFMESISSLGFADYLKNNGLSSRAPYELLNSARLSGKSIWSVLKDTLPYATGRRKPHSSAVENIDRRKTVANQHGLSGRELSRDLPIWVTEPNGIPPAKFDQVNGLLHMAQVREVLDRSRTRELVHPLISQPLIELCLRFPAYLLCTNGQSRGLARSAFTGAIPERIRRRMTKGTVSRYSIDNLEANLDQISNSLMNGELVNCGMIHRAELEVFFREEHYRLQKYGRMMLVYYVIEAWLSKWTAILQNARSAA